MNTEQLTAKIQELSLNLQVLVQQRDAQANEVVAVATQLALANAEIEQLKREIANGTKASESNEE